MEKKNKEETSGISGCQNSRAIHLKKTNKNPFLPLRVIRFIDMNDSLQAINNI